MGPTRSSAVVVSLALALSLAGCSSRTDSAIQVTVDVAPTVKSNCLKLVIQGEGRPEVLSAAIPRKERVQAAIYASNELTGTVTVLARGYVGADCQGTLTLNDESLPGSETFAQGEIKKLALSLKALPAAADVDGDGYRAASVGGPDCADTSALVNPGVTESCTDLQDNNCDGRTDCADPACAAAACNDGQLCTTNDRCEGAGTCSGTPVVCNVPAGMCAGAGSCNPQTGACVFATPSSGQSCNDGNVCTTSDLCLADGGCRGSLIDCTTPPAVCLNAVGVCNPDGGSCQYSPSDAGAPCDDGDPCTSADSCNGAASCQGVTVQCNTPPGACFAAAGTCGAGGCSYSVDLAATCSDGDPCTLNDVCQSDGGCGSSAPITCDSPPNSCFGSAGACLGDGGCEYAVSPGSTFLSCDGGVCRPDGGCEPPGFPYQPSNFDPAAVPQAAIAGAVTLALNCLAEFDSSPGISAPFLSWCGQPQPTPQVVTQPGGPDAVVLPMFSLRIEDGGTLRIKGSRPVILAIYDNAEISGQLLSNATSSDAGAGGFLTACAGAGANGTAPAGRGTGGGGAGFGSNGGMGGANSAGVVGGVAGVSHGNSTLIPLGGGCSGGLGGSSGAVALGGAGGGALQVSSAGALVVGGTISVSGGGGSGGSVTAAGGGAGGSGGAILLQAGQLSVFASASLTSNGGGGGKGFGNNASGGNGADGSPTTANFASGGTTGGGSAGNGGSGGAGATLPTQGLNSTHNNSGGGGGGGAVGRIRLEGVNACTISGSAVISPPASRPGCP